MREIVLTVKLIKGRSNFVQVFHSIKPNWIEIKELRDMVFQTYPDPPVPKSYFKVKAFFKKILL